MGAVQLGDLVVRSLEVWDEVWQRNQLVLSELMSMDTSARLLFVEPAIDVTYDLLGRRQRQKPAKGRPPPNRRADLGLAVLPMDLVDSGGPGMR